MRVRAARVLGEESPAGARALEVHGDEKLPQEPSDREPVNEYTKASLPRSHLSYV